ncbi:MAG: alpha/beta fold hydrolase [Actinobacteria bacterium]|nr:alpha/beta fold hydrolase [Actinomycetota bacterium]
MSVPVGARVSCGTLTVLEDRDDLDGPVVQLPVAVLHSRAPHVRPDPIVYASGGPGLPGLADLDRFVANDVGGDRDVILFDQRGTGAAAPSLACPEVTDAIVAVLETADAPSRDQARVRGGYDACRARLIGAGIDLAAYNTAATVEDLVDLRHALGIRSWNVFGASYGTTVALDLMRERPHGIRSVVLDSVLPTTVEFGGGATAINLVADAFAHVFAGCAADASCHSNYPTLPADYWAMIGELDAAPIHTTVTGPAGRPMQIVLTGDDIVAGLYNALYDPTLIGLVPQVIELLHHHQYGIVATLAAQALPVLTGTSQGMAASVICAERQRLSNPSAAADAERAHPETSTLVTLSVLPLCDAWDVPSLPARFNHPVRSTIRTLVLAGEYDPVTPPAYGNMAAHTLRRSEVVEFPGLGHTSIGYPNPCPSAIFHAFLDAPDNPVDRACAAAMPSVHWQ